MPKKAQQQKLKEQQQANKFALVPQSLEDRDFEGKAVLVPEAQVRNQFRQKRANRAPLMMFEEDLPDDTIMEERMNLGIVDDEVEERIFEDEIEEDFDENWIRQMMTGEGVEGFEDIVDGDDFDEEAKHRRMTLAAMYAKYPKHEERGANEKQFDQMMADFDLDEDIHEADPRTHGALPVQSYAAAMEQFIAENAGTSIMGGSEQPVRHKGYIKQLHIMAKNNDALSMPGREVLTVTDRREREIDSFFEDADVMKQEMIDALRKKLIDERTISVGDDVQKEIEAHMRADGSLRKPSKETIKKNLPQFVQDAMDNVEKRSHREDCETVLTTLTSTFNLPNVITVDRTKRLKVPKATTRIPRSQLTKSQQQNDDNNNNEENDENEEEEEYEDDGMDLGEEAMLSEVLKQQRVALSTRTSDESKEEKKHRKALVKQMQREARQVKKQVKTEFGKTGREQTETNLKSTRDKHTTTLSSIRGNMVA